jgi:hypothetical protein
MRELAIVGSHPDTSGNAPYDNELVEIWAFNEGAMRFPRVDVPFQMHADWANKGTHYSQWLEAQPFTYKRSNYPFEDVFALTNHVKLGKERKPLRFFTSSPSYALALAALQDRPKINLYGIEYMMGAERREQRESFAFWVGFCAGRDIPITINCADNIFNKPLYGE